MEGGEINEEDAADDRDFFDGTMMSTATAEKELTERELRDCGHYTRNRVTALPLNKTLLSAGEDRVVIIKPEGDRGRELINNPIKLNSMLDQSEFGNIEIKDIRVNKRKEMIIIELAESSRIEELLKIKHLNEYPIRVYTPENESYKSGVIWPVSRDADLEEIKRHLVIDNKGNGDELHKIERLKKKTGETWIETESIKVTFKCKNLPQGVKIARSFYKVRPFVNMPLQCYKCQRMGHMAINCKGNVRCLVCGENHDRKDCKSLQPKCAGCGGRHKANDKECPLVKKAREIERMKSQGRTHLEAYRQVHGTVKKPEQSTDSRQINSALQKHTILAEVHHRMNSQVATGRREGNILYSEALIGEQNWNDNDKPMEKEPCNCGKVSDRKVQEIVAKEMTQMVAKLGKLLLELFTSSILKESIVNRQLIIRNLMKNCMNCVLPMNPVPDKNTKQNTQGYDEENMEIMSEDEAVLSSDSIENIEGEKKKPGKRPTDNKSDDHVSDEGLTRNQRRNSQKKRRIKQ